MKNKQFLKLLSDLKKHGYRMRIRKIKYSGKFQYWFAFHRKKTTGIYLGFCTPNNGESYSYLDGKVSADNINCFDKWSKCPICLPFPTNKTEFNFLLDKIKFLGSDKGYKWSSSYDYLDNPITKYTFT